MKLNIALIIGLFLGIIVVSGGIGLHFAPRGVDSANAKPLPIDVIGRQFEWRIRYPLRQDFLDDSKRIEDFQSGPLHFGSRSDATHTVNKLHVWRGATVRIRITSQDVGHALAIPSLEMKQGIHPGRIDEMTFVASEANCQWDEAKGKLKIDPTRPWQVECADLCGWGHDKMRGRFYVHTSRESFLEWLKLTENGEPIPTTDSWD